jgi:hypothetical protein
MSQWITEKTIRYAVLKMVESNPGLNYMELRKLMPNKNIMDPLLILTQQKKLIRKRVKHPFKAYIGIWTYYSASVKLSV